MNKDDKNSDDSMDIDENSDESMDIDYTINDIMDTDINININTVESEIRIGLVKDRDNFFIFFFIKNIYFTTFFEKFKYLRNKCFNINDNYAAEKSIMSLYYISEKKMDFNLFSTKDNIFYWSNFLKQPLENTLEYKSIFGNTPLANIINSISFTFTINQHDNLIEIFDVCSQYPKAKQPISGKSLTELSFRYSLLFICLLRDNTSSNIIFNLGVEFENPNYEAAVKLYLKCTFTNPIISTDLFKTTNSKPFVKLKTDCDILYRENLSILKSGDIELLSRIDIIETDFEKAKMLKQVYFAKVYYPYIIKIIITRKLDNYMKSLLTKGVETAGSFMLKKISSDNSYYLEYVCDSESIGTINTVELKYDTPIFMHVHDYASISAATSLHAWPSAPDWHSTFKRIVSFCLNYNSMSLMCVYSPEGYYFLQPTESLFDFIKKGDIIIGGFIYLSILFMFSEMDDFRTETITDITKNAVYFYMNVINMINIEFLIKRTKIFIQNLYTDIINGKDTLYIAFNTINDQVNNFLNSYTYNSKYKYDIFNLYKFGKNKKKLILFLKNFIKKDGGDYFKYIRNINNKTKPLLICNFVDELNINNLKNDTYFFYYNSTNLEPIQDTNKINLNTNLSYFESDSCYINGKFNNDIIIN